MRKIALAASLALAAALGTSLATVSAQDSVSAQDGAGGAYPAEAIFAGGCFWCIESDFEKIDGVGDVVSGYSGGTNESPTYENHTKYGHLEVVRVPYDPAKVSYEALVNAFYRSVNPTDAGGQFCDRGHSYTTAIFAKDAEQMEIARKVTKDVQPLLDKPIVTPIKMAQTFWPAEDYHQDYAKKKPIRYNYYRGSCGRDRTVKTIWGTEAYKGTKEKTS